MYVGHASKRKRHNRVPDIYLNVQHDKKNLYSTDYVYVGASTNNTKPPRYASYAINSPTSIKHSKALHGATGCNGSAIFLAANPDPPYTVYGSDYWGLPGCGTVMSVDSTGKTGRSSWKLDAQIQRLLSYHLNMVRHVFLFRYVRLFVDKFFTRPRAFRYLFD